MLVNQPLEKRCSYNVQCFFGTFCVVLLAVIGFYLHSHCFYVGFMSLFDAIFNGNEFYPLITAAISAWLANRYDQSDAERHLVPLPYPNLSLYKIINPYLFNRAMTNVLR